jgi:hypothetical protein
VPYVKRGTRDVAAYANRTFRHRLGDLPGRAEVVEYGRTGECRNIFAIELIAEFVRTGRA